MDDHPAKNLKVNQDIVDNPSNINAGSVIDGTGEDGESSRAKRIAEIRNMRLDIQGIKDREQFIESAFKDYDKTDDKKNDLSKIDLRSDSSGDTIEAYYKGMIAQLGVSGQEASRVVENQQNLILQLDIQRQSVSGVNLDEEMIDMLQFQRAYQANSKMVTVIDELLNVVVNGLIR